MVQLDIPMPKTCYECPCHDGENNSCQVTGKYYYGEILRSCPLIELPSAEPKQRWIPCSERLPEEEKKTYWVCTDTEYQCECRWTNNRFGIGKGEWGWSIFDTPQYSKPIAWMPLPEPYKEEQCDTKPMN